MSFSNCIFIIHAIPLNICFTFSWGKVSNHLWNPATVTRRLTRKDWTIWLLSLAAVTPLPRGVPPCFQWIPVWKQLNSYMICIPKISQLGQVGQRPLPRLVQLLRERVSDIKKLVKLIDFQNLHGCFQSGTLLRVRANGLLGASWIYSFAKLST